MPEFSIDMQTLSLVLQYLSVALAGFLVGYSELLSRYRDINPRHIFDFGIAWLYLIINVGAACATLYLIQVIGIQLGPVEGSAAGSIYAVILAGFSSMAMLRSSFMNVRVGDRDIQVGIAQVLNVLLSAADRGVDRRLGEERAATVDQVMPQVSFNQAKERLPVFGFSLMQNVSEEEQRKARAAIDDLEANEDLDPATRVRTLGLVLLTIMGKETLTAAVEKLGGSIQHQSPLSELLSTIDYGKARSALPAMCFVLASTPEAEQAAFTTEINQLEARTDLSPAALTLVFGQLLMGVVGEETLSKAIYELGDLLH